MGKNAGYLSNKINASSPNKKTRKNSNNSSDSQSASLGGSSTSSLKTEISDEYLVREEKDGKVIHKMEHIGISLKH